MGSIPYLGWLTFLHPHLCESQKMTDELTKELPASDRDPIYRYWVAADGTQYRTWYPVCGGAIRGEQGEQWTSTGWDPDFEAYDGPLQEVAKEDLDLSLGERD